MPITYTLDPARERMTTHATGLVTFADLNAHLDAEERDHALGYAELFDARDATTDLTAEEVRRLVSRARTAARRQRVGPTALVATDDVVYGMARMYGTLCEQFAVAVAVFRELAPAEQWLAEQAL